jgi:hypothetical protein
VARLPPPDTGVAPGVPVGATCGAGFGVRPCDPGTTATPTAPTVTVATAATAATFAPPPARSERMRSRTGPRLSALTARRRRLAVTSSAPARCRRARKISVSTADCETPRSSAISAYDRPFHSRSRNGRRRFGGIFASASARPISSSCWRRASGMRSLTCSRSAACSSFVRRELATARETQTFCAILNSHAVSEWEGALDRVLGLLAGAQSREAEPVDPCPVSLVEKGCLAIRVRRVLNKNFCHVLPCLLTLAALTAGGVYGRYPTRRAGETSPMKFSSRPPGRSGRPGRFFLAQT